MNQHEFLRIGLFLLLLRGDFVTAAILFINKNDITTKAQKNKTTEDIKGTELGL
jgi:hypothetical protein